MTVQQNSAVSASPAPRRWSAVRTALTTAGLGAVLVALTACGPNGADGAPSTAPTTALTPAAVATPAVGAPLTAEGTHTTAPVTTGPVTSDPSGFMSMDMDLPSGATDQQFVDANGNHVNLSRNTGGGHSEVSNSSCDASGCETQVIENN